MITKIRKIAKMNTFKTNLNNLSYYFNNLNIIF